ncbi:MAG: DUF971 domain-containing protein, partial [Planctomycetota bacterium]
GGRVLRPEHLDLDRERALTVRWSDGRVSIYPVRYLRKMSPSAEAKQLREEIAKNPLTVLPSSAVSDGPLRAEAIELVGHYAVRVRFSDGHDTGIYSWRYLREIDPSKSLVGGESADGPADTGDSAG